MSKKPNLDDLSFDAVIPSILLLNDNIEPNAIKLYAFIRGLTRSHGYCFATNEYLSECMRSDVRSVQRLLNSLKDEGFLQIETEKNGIHWQRKIFVAVGLKKILRRDNSVTPPRQNCHPPLTKLSPILGDIQSRDIEREREPAAPTPPLSTSFSHKRVKMDSSKMASLVSDFGNEKVQEMMDRLDEYADINPKRFKQYACHATVIRKWIRDDGQKVTQKGNHIVQNVQLKFLERLKAKYGNHPEIEISDQGVSFIAGNYTIQIKTTDNGFQDQILGRLRKMNLSVEGL